MKKVLCGFLFLALAFAFSLSATDDKGAPLRKGGGTMADDAKLNMGDFALSKSSITIPCYAYVALTAGDAVIISSDTTYPASVSKTSSLMEENVFGFATEDVAANALAKIAVAGVAKARVAVSVTKGALLVPSAVAGLLTVTAAVTEAVTTGLSGTALCAIAMESKTYSGTTLDIIVKVK